MHLWCRLIPQANITLNLLRGSRVNPKLSAYAQVHVPFDFNRTPLAPPGNFVLGHEKPDKRKTWDTHAVDAWYVGPAMDSYRCYEVWCISTRATRICDTVEWFPHHVAMPTPSATDLVLTAAADLAKALQNPCPNYPLHPLADNELHKIHELQTILHNRASPTPTTTPPTAPHTDPKVSFYQSLTTDILPPNARTLRRRRERVAKQKPPDTNHPKDSIAARVHRHPNRPPTTAHKDKAARTTRANSAANRKALARTSKSTATLPTHP
jgi:hypothetical protein